MKRLLAALLACALTAPSRAADAPKHTCDRPVVPAAQASDPELADFNRRAVEYKQCLMKFVQDQLDLSKQTTDRAKSDAAFEAADAAVQEYTIFHKELSARNAPEH